MHIAPSLSTSRSASLREGLAHVRNLPIISSRSSPFSSSSPMLPSFAFSLSPGDGALRASGAQREYVCMGRARACDVSRSPIVKARPVAERGGREGERTAVR